ncbi:MAG TPA: hypothetical protein VFH85_01100 [Gammaproteobacteria bacterium]|nr:hypothetical protein [Gammaproteobacteria bacterium]
MKKIIIAIVLVLAAGGAAAWYFVAGPGAGSAANSYAAVVPANTLFYMGSSQPNEFAQAMSSLREARLESMSSDLEKSRVASRYGQAGLFLAGLLEAYNARVSQGKSVPGIPRVSHSVAYSVGIVPVLRMQVNNAAAFKQFLDDAEQRGGAQSVKASYQGVAYRDYPLQLNNKPVPVSLLVAVRPHFLVVTLDVPSLRDESLPLALGLKKPAHSLAQSGLIQRIAEKNGFANNDIGFFNHQAVVAAVIGTPGSLAGEMLTSLDSHHGLAPLRQQGCAAYLQSIAKVWPMTVMGMLPVNGAAPDEVVLRERMVSRLTDPSLTATLGKLRGHVPAALLDGSQKPMLAVALGLDVSSLAAVATDLQQRFLQADYPCDWLIDAQQDVRQKNPAAMTVATVMISGLRGVSASVFGLFGPPAGGKMSLDADALVNISATNPRALVQLVKRMKPTMFGDITIPDDGSSVVLPGNGKLEVRAMIAGHHFVLFTGKHATEVAKNLAAKDLQPNGLVYYRMDYGKLMPELEKAIAQRTPKGKMAEKMRSVRKSLRSMAQSKLRLQMSLDIEKPGAVVDVKAAVAKPSPGH